MVVAVVVVVILVLADQRFASRLDAVPSDMLTGARRDLIAIGFAGIVIGALLARMLNRSIAQPYEDLSAVAKTMAAGDLSRRPGLERDSEIAEIGDALRSLSNQLQAAHNAVVAEQSQVTTLTDSLQEGVIAVDARRNVVRINEKARQLLRLNGNVPFSADQLPRDATLIDALQLVLSGTEPNPGQVTVDDRVLSLSARPLPNGGALLTLYDLTPFRRLELVRRDFVANVSHELRTPLTLVRGAVETLQDADLPDDLRQRFLEMADGNVRRMQRIVDDLLDLSRIESGGWLPNATHQNFAAVASEVLTTLDDAAQAKGVVLRVAVGAEAATIYADPTATRQILSNLAENALRHTTAGEVVLFSEHDAGGNWIGVRDSGVGIEAVHIPRIFERFYRADPGRSREAGGTGLGLAIVRHLAESHGGSVRAESTPGTGTMISVFLPDDDRTDVQLT